MLGFKSSLIQLILFFTWALQYYTFGYIILWYILSGALGIAVIFAVTTYDHDYWLNRGVFSPPGLPIVGHIKNVVAFKEQGGLCFKRIYDSYKNLRFLGKLCLFILQSISELFPFSGLFWKENFADDLKLYLLSEQAGGCGFKPSGAVHPRVPRTVYGPLFCRYLLT